MRRKRLRRKRLRRKRLRCIIYGVLVREATSQLLCLQMAGAGYWAHGCGNMYNQLFVSKTVRYHMCTVFCKKRT